MRQPKIGVSSSAARAPPPPPPTGVFSALPPAVEDAGEAAAVAEEPGADTDEAPDCRPEGAASPASGDEDADAVADGSDSDDTDDDDDDNEGDGAERYGSEPGSDAPESERRGASSPIASTTVPAGGRSRTARLEPAGCTSEPARDRAA